MRIKYIDYTKGLAILLMLFGHTMTETNDIHRWIYSFHMPIFFIVCGILTYNKKRLKKETRIWKRIYTSAIPYYIFGIIMIIFYTLLDIISVGQSSFNNRLFKLFTFQGIDSLWFLPIYVFSDIIFSVLVNRKKQYIILTTIFSYLAIIFCGEYLVTTWYLQIVYKVLLGFCFIGIGFIISRSQCIEKLNNFVVYIGIIIGWFLAQINGSVEMAANNIGNPILYFFNATITSIAIMTILKKLSKWKDNSILRLLERYGKNSIVVLCTNNLLIEIIRLLDFKITGNILISSRMIGSIILFIVLMGIEYIIIKLANGFLAPVFGYKKNRQFKASRQS